MDIGACYRGKGICDFRVWAPARESVWVNILSTPERMVPMVKDGEGYFSVRVEGIEPGTRYLYALGDETRPDPASQFQPDGVHGPSAIVDQGAFPWRDATWRGLAVECMVLYEVHVGTFTPEGTFDAATARLSELKDLGINAIEVMPVGEFPGVRNWGYDGVYPFSVHRAYGGPEGFKRFVDACHAVGMAVVLDVVYNHLGPEGNYLSCFGPYFTDRYRTPWGEAVNFDGAGSDGVRNYFVEHARFFFRDYHVDALRLDAIHGIFDFGAKHILEELSERVEAFSAEAGRKVYLIAESDLNDVRTIRDREQGGHGIDAQWCDDFHHCVHTLLTGERKGYYCDFGEVDQFVTSLNDGFVYSWRYSSYRKKHFGSSSKGMSPHRFVAFTQNHDQVGNRLAGERLSKLVSFDALKLAAVANILSPYIPLLFMGEEYAEEAPFLYFVNHGDAGLIEAVRKGRAEEFATFEWKGNLPDPQGEETFAASKLRWNERREGKHGVMLEFYRRLIALRGGIPAFAHAEAEASKAWRVGETDVVVLERRHQEGTAFVVMHFGRDEVSIAVDFASGGLHTVIDSSDLQWLGAGSTFPSDIRGGDIIRLRPFCATVLVTE
jgi:maltooligosyltrehalose trehalohydrolase